MSQQNKNVLLVTNATNEVEIEQIKCALNESNNQRTSIKLSLVHVIPMLPSSYFHIPSMALLAKRYSEEAQQTIAFIGNELNVPSCDQWLMTGKIRTEVLRLAKKLNVHFILASSTSIQDLHKSFLFKQNKTPIKNINLLGASL
jgi:hypothetical protein